MTIDLKTIEMNVRYGIFSGPSLRASMLGNCWVFLFFALCPHICGAQVSQADSLLALIKQAPDDTSRWQRLGALVKYYQLTNPATGIEYAYQQIELGKKIDDARYLESMISLASLYNRMNKVDSVEVVGNQVLEKSRAIGNEVFESKALSTLSVVDSRRGNFAQAIEKLLAALEKAKAGRDSLSILNNLGLAYFKDNQNEAGLKSYLLGLEISKRLGEKRQQAMIQSNMSMIYEQMGSYQEAIEMLEEATMISESINDRPGLLFKYNRLGQLFFYRKLDENKGAAFFEKQLQLAYELKDTFWIVGTLVDLTEVKLRKNLYEAAENHVREALSIIPPGSQNMQEFKIGLLIKMAYLENKKGAHGSALQYALSAKSLLNETVSENNPGVDRELTKSYIGLGRSAEALAAFENFNESLDSFYVAQNIKETAEINAKYQTAEKEKVIAALERDKALNKAEIERRKLQVAMVSLGALLLMGFGSGYYLRYRYRQRLELERMRTRIASDLHDEVGSSLSHLNLLIGSLDVSADPALTARSIEKSKDIMQKTASNIRDVVWAVDARRDKTGDLLDRMEDFAFDMFSQRNITYHFKTDGIQRDDTLKPFVRQNIYLIYKEAVNNIAKHSSATEVDISLRQTGSALELTVADNGHSLNLNKAKGQGLENMQLRAERIGGMVEIRKGEDGFSVKLGVPL